MSGGPPRQITRIPDEIVAYDWSPDGKQLALTRFTQSRDVVADQQLPLTRGTLSARCPTIGNFANWNISPDRKYFYFTTAGAEPKAQRLRLADRQIEIITSLKDFRQRAEATDITVAPDGSPVFTRDIGSQEIYALSVRWP